MSSESKEPGGIVDAGAAQPNTQPRRSSIEERRRLVAESLRIGNPENRARNLPEQADPKQLCQIELKVEDIRPYEHNPRRSNNAKFSEIKESIRVTGILNALAVTRRPGQHHFIVKGGNSRLIALQQLWRESRDPRFERVMVVFHPWRSEAHVRLAHLTENETRGDLTFWDKANGVLAVKADIEEVKGRKLSLRQLEEELKAGGLSVSPATLTYYLYATAWLRTLGDAIPVLTGLDVRTIQLRLGVMRRYAQLRSQLPEAELYAEVFEPVFVRCALRYGEGQPFNAVELAQAAEAALAEHFGEDVARLRMVLHALSQSPQASLDALNATVQDQQRSRDSAAGAAVQGGERTAQGDDGTVYSVNRARTAQGGDGTVYSVNSEGRHSDSRESRTVTSAPSTTSLDDSLRMKTAIAHFARAANVAGCLREWSAAPLGYYMELPQPVFDDSPQAQGARSAWELLACLSGQFNDSVLRLLPETSDCRQSGSFDRGGPPGAPNSSANDVSAIRAVNTQFFNWLLVRRDETAEAFWHLMSAVRKAVTPVSSPQPTSTSSAETARKR